MKLTKQKLKQMIKEGMEPFPTTPSEQEAWKAAGGFAVHHVGSVDDTIAELDRIKENSDVPEEPSK